MPDAVAREDKPETAMTSRNSNSFVFETLETRKLMSSGGPAPTDWPSGPRMSAIAGEAETLAPTIPPRVQLGNNPTDASDSAPTV